MHTNTTTPPNDHQPEQKPFDILQLSGVAQAYYESLRSNTLVSGGERYVLTDGKNCLFVPPSYPIAPGQAMFRCRTRQGGTEIELFMAG